MAKHIEDKTHSGNELRTICEMHRELYDIVYGVDGMEEACRILQEAYTAAKKMDAKLRQYAGDYDNEWWELEREIVISEKIQNRTARSIERKEIKKREM